MKKTLHTGYMIMTTSPWYPGFYAKTVQDMHKRGFSIFNTEDEALLELPKALNERNGINMSIVKTYWYSYE